MIASLLALAFLQPAQAGRQAAAASNPFLIHACQVSVQLHETRTPAPNEEATRFDIACVSYIQGFADAAALTQSLCVKNVKTGTLAKEYIAYMDQHPELLSQDRALSLAASVRENHPCPAK
jgi:hypothetical protein